MVLLVLILAGCQSAEVEGRLVAYDSVATHVQMAATALQATSGLRVQGTVRGSDAKNLTLDLRLTGSGDGVGEVTRNAVPGSVAVIDGSTYVRAAAAWWAPDSRADSYSGTWVRAAATTVGLDFAGMLRPRQLGELVDETFTQSVPAHPPVTTVRGVAAQQVATDDGVIWVSTKAPYRALRVDGDFLTYDERPVSLSLTTLSPSATAQTSRDVALLLPQFKGGTYDAQHVLQFQGALGSSCDPDGCTITGMVHNPSTDASVTAVLNGKLVGNKKMLLGRCRSARATVAAGATTLASCRVSDAAWRSFYAGATAPGAPMATTKYQVSASASALAPAPPAVGCQPGGAGCAPPEPTGPQVDATFRRSAKTFYGKPVGEDALPAWRNLIHAATASKDRTPWSSLGTPTVAYLGASQGRPFVAQYNRGNGSLVSAYGPDDAETTALRQAISGRP